MCVEKRNIVMATPSCTVTKLFGGGGGGNIHTVVTYYE